MKKSSFGADGLLARMVVFMPNVALEVLNKCQSTIYRAKKNSTSYEAVKYDFFALQTTKGNVTQILTFLRNNMNMRKRIIGLGDLSLD